MNHLALSFRSSSGPLIAVVLDVPRWTSPLLHEYPTTQQTKQAPSYATQTRTARPPHVVSAEYLVAGPCAATAPKIAPAMPLAKWQVPAVCGRYLKLVSCPGSRC